MQDAEPSVELRRRCAGPGLKNRHDVARGSAIVDDDGQFEARRQLELALQSHFLHGFGAFVPIIIEADLADG